VWKEYNADYDFAYSFLDETFDATYKSDLRTGKRFTIFAVIALFISCLGLFGLVTYTAEMKTKEIGIRKVLGASVASIVEMLSKEFLILVGIAMVIAFPVAYYLLDKMLQDYAYRISIGWWMFSLAGVIVVVLTLLTVGWKAIKAATANPVKAIKSE
jgi:putative ABC transport system permease protein